jgi:hypothetical protein
MIKLKKKNMKSLSFDKSKLPVELTADIAGAGKPYSYYDNCNTQPMTYYCTDLCTPSVGAGCATSNMC